MFYRSLLHSNSFRYLGSLYMHSLVRLFAVSMFQIFNSIYIFQVLKSFGLNSQQALATTVLLLSLIFLMQAVAIFPSIWLCMKKGLRFSIFWGSMFLIGFFCLLFLGKYDPIFLVLACILGGLQTGLYWTAFNIYFVELTSDKNQGEEIGLGLSLSTIASIGGPAFGGVLISFAGFGATFLVMAILVTLALLPLKFLPKQDDKISVDILKIALVFKPKKELRSFISITSNGIIDVVGAYLWPLFVFPLLSGFVGVGLMGSLIALAATISGAAIGFLIDKIGAKRVLSIVSSLDSLIWTLKAFVLTPFQILTVSSISSLTTSSQIMSVDSLIYERGRHFNIVALILQREVGLAIGKFLFLCTMGMLVWFGLPFAAIFIIVALTALSTRVYPAVNIFPK